MTGFDIIGFLGTVLTTGYVTLYLSDGFRWIVGFLFDELPEEESKSTGHVEGNELII